MPQDSKLGPEPWDGRGASQVKTGEGLRGVLFRGPWTSKL